ncbi:MAG: type II CRISPR-associated endonuclease Cas1 [Kiritimatiellia bacterium]
MIARTLSFSSPGKLFAKDAQLVYEGEDGVRRSFPIEDLGFVILETGLMTVSSHCIRQLADANVALVVCDATHTPSAQMLPFAAHTTTQETVAAQLGATAAVQGRLWRQVVRAKILNQSELLRRLGFDASRRLRAMADEVKNYDAENVEAQAARIYFRALAPDPGFVRAREGTWPNPALNYGYGVLRAAVARALVGSGLTCFRGVHHHNRYNAFCLADDMMEPYRPFVDQYVFGHVPPFDVQATELTREMKARLLQMLTCDVKTGDLKRPLMVALTYTTASLAKYYLGKTDHLVLPSFL